MGRTKTSSARYPGKQFYKEFFIKLPRKEVINMNTIAKEVRGDLDACPFCDAKADVCRASVTSLKIGALVRFKRCNSENYDNCALFLAKCLRSRWQYGYGF
jgi:hypothetical protein